MAKRLHVLPTAQVPVVGIIEMLEGYLAQAKAGELRAVGIVYVSIEKGEEFSGWDVTLGRATMPDTLRGATVRLLEGIPRKISYR